MEVDDCCNQGLPNYSLLVNINQRTGEIICTRIYVREGITIPSITPNPNPLIINGDIEVNSLITDTIVGKTQPNDINLAGIVITNSKIPINALAQSPLIFKGTWNAATNVPHLASSVGTNGDYYIVSVDGNTNLNGYTDWLMTDVAVFDGTLNSWIKLDNYATNLSSVGGTSLVVNGNGPMLTIKGISAGNGIILTPNVNDIGISLDSSYSGSRVEYYDFSANGTFATIPAFPSQYVWVSSGSNPTITNNVGTLWNPAAGVSSITRVPGTALGPNSDGFTCSKRIIIARFHVQLQFSVGNNRIRARIYVNGLQVASEWMDSTTIANGRTSSVVEWGNIPAGQLVEIRLTDWNSASIQDAGTYVILITEQ